MKRLALFSYHRRFLMLGIWAALLVGAFVSCQTLAGEFRTEFKLPGSESQAALDLLEAEGDSNRTGFPGQVVFRADNGVNDPAVKQAMEKFFADLEARIPNSDVESPYDAQNSYRISKDGKIAYAQVNLADRDQEGYFEAGKAGRELRSEFNTPGVQVELGSDIFVEEQEFGSEGIGILAAVVILLIAFGSVLAMGLPIITAIFGIITGSAIIGLSAHVLDVPEFTPLVAAMIGIGVGIDYALLIVTRYRQGLHDGLDPEGATVLAIDTSGRAVLFAGATVVISLLGMLAMNLDFMRSMAIGAVSAVLMTMFASLTLLPALLGFTGRNIDRFGLPHRKQAEQGSEERSFWYRWSRLIQKHPWPALVAGVVFLLILAAPVLSIRLGFSDAGNRKTTDTTRRAYDMLAEGFGPGYNGGLMVVSNTPNGQADMAVINRLRDAIAATPGVASVAPAFAVADGKLQIFEVIPTTAPQDEATTELVHKIRNEVRPSVVTGSSPQVYVAGGPPGVVDFADYMGQRLPIFFGAVLLLSFLLLMTVFHSVIVPLKAVLMNMLSIGAAFGVLVAVFQWGVGLELLGVGKEGPIDAWVPMMLFAIVFGLSMDYEVFLLTRVREEYDRTGDNSRAVADGLAATGRVISAAAAIMVCVFAAFILGPDRSVKLMGLGLASAIFIDATIVRLLLVPAAMELMGKMNWWAPEWLVKILPTIRVDTVEKPVPEPSKAGA